MSWVKRHEKVEQDLFIFQCFQVFSRNVFFLVENSEIHLPVMYPPKNHIVATKPPPKIRRQRHMPTRERSTPRQHSLG